MPHSDASAKHCMKRPRFPGRLTQEKYQGRPDLVRLAESRDVVAHRVVITWEGPGCDLQSGVGTQASGPTLRVLRYPRVGMYVGMTWD